MTKSAPFKNFFYREYNTAAEQIKTPNFQENNEYVYSYNAQVENGMLSSVDSSGTKEESQQQAITRIQSQIRMYFSSERRGQLCMTQLKFGQFNDMRQMKEKQCYDPMGMFEPVSLENEKLENFLQFSVANSPRDSSKTRTLLSIRLRRRNGYSNSVRETRRLLV